VPNRGEQLHVDLNELFLFLEDHLSDIPHERLEKLFDSLRKYITEQDNVNAKKIEELSHHVDRRMDDHEAKSDTRTTLLEKQVQRLETRVLHALGNGLNSDMKQLKKWVANGNTKFFKLLMELKTMVVENTEWRKQQQWEQTDGAKRMDRRKNDRRTYWDRFWSVLAGVLAALAAVLFTRIL